MGSFKTALFSFLFFLVAATAATADEVILKSGGVLKGDVTTEGAEQVVLKTPYGTVTLDMADVSEVKYSTADEKKILANLAVTKPTDTAARLRLAKRASSVDLDDVARRIYAEILAIDPDEKTAREALGYIFYEGEWVIAADKSRHPGLVPYRGRWVSVEERDGLVAADVDREFFAQFSLTPSQGHMLMEAISDFDVTVEPRGGYIVRQHVKTYEVKDKPYMYSVDALTWKRLGVFIGVTFFDKAQKRIRGIGELKYAVYSVAADAVGNKKQARMLTSGTLSVTPEMWEKKSDFSYWDTRVNSGSYEKIASDEFKARWRENRVMNFDGFLYLLANPDCELLTPPGIYYVEAVFILKGREKKVGRYVQYAEPR